MATSFTTTRAAADFPVFQPTGSGVLCAAYASVTFDDDVTLAAALTVSMCKLPANAVLLGGYVMGADIDTGTEAFDFDIGWAANGVDAADPDGLGNLGVMSGDVITELKPVAGIYVPFQGLLFTDGPKTFTKPTTLTLTVNADANAGGTGKLTMVAFYVVP